MGLLDDAIREHLELKRRRGADETEVTRQEQEALGPARRGDVEDATATAEPDVAPGLPGEFAAEEQTVLHVVPQPEPEPDHDPEPIEEPFEAPVHRLHEQEEQHEPPRPHGDPADDLPPASEPPRIAREDRPVQDEPPRPHGDPAADLPEVEQATRAFDAAEVRAATMPPPVSPPPPRERAPEPEPERAPEPEPEHAPAPPRAEDEADAPRPDGDDVLEETPEFLQETPEHDRLWFEQRPPRDFDF